MNHAKEVLQHHGVKSIDEEVKRAMDVESFLTHYGVKGMHWGKRKAPAHSDSAQSTAVKTAAKKQGVHTVSNKDLQDAISRMNLEQNFKRLRVNEKSPVTRWISSTLLEVGKREVQSQVTKKIVKVATKAAVGA